jgi:hypothetical protein
MATTAESSAATPSKKKTTAKTSAKVAAKAVTKAKPASRAAPPKAPVKKAAVTAPTRKPSAPSKVKSPRVSNEQRSAFVEVAAYYIAERHGFTGGREAEDWLAAEAEIDRLLKEGKLTGS